METPCFLVVLVLALLVIGSCAGSVTNPISQSDQNKICMSKDCIQASASILERIDTSVAPCDDFYTFACGNFIKKTVIPEDESSVSMFSYQNTVNYQLKTVYEKPITYKDPHFLMLLKNMYKSCMSTDKIEKKGLVYFRELIKSLGGWPTVEPEWSEKNFDWVNTLHQIRRIGWEISPLFEISVEVDVKNSSRHILTMSQGATWNPWMQEGLNNTKVAANLQFSIEISTLFGANRTTATSDMEDVFQLAITLSKFALSLEEFDNKSMLYNIVTLQEFQQQHPNLPWFTIVNNFLNTEKKFNPDDVINVAGPSFFKKLDEFLPTVKKRLEASPVVDSKKSINYLPNVFRDKKNDYLKVIGGHQNIYRWKTCVEDSINLDMAVSSIYVKNFVDLSIRSKVSEMAKNIKNALIDNLNQNDWMDSKTKRQAILKARKMAFVVGYSDAILNETKVDEIYKNLTLDGSEYYLKIYFNISKYNHQRMVATLTEKAIWRNWQSIANFYEVNARYMPELNSFVIPGAILSSLDWYKPGKPRYINYGVIGSVIGHEITHGFDNHGRQNDQNGLLFDWWEPETEKKFDVKSECLVEQYGNFTVAEIGQNLNGKQTLGENIADNGGVKIAYKAYLKSQQKNKEELLLPGLPYNQKQLFWISFATAWCQKFTKESLEEVVLADVHSPARFRVTGSLRNSKSFAKDFGCRLGSKMNPIHKCQVW